MDTKTMTFSPSKTDLSVIPCPFIPLSEVFSHNHSKESINPRLLYVALFDTLPCWIYQKSINIKKAQQWFAIHYADDIRDTYFNKRCFKLNALAEYDDFIYVMHDGLVVYFDTGCQSIEILFDNSVQSKADRLHRELHRWTPT